MTDKKDSTVIRYTKEVMISLHDSPLVQKPESMPSLLSWFGEDPDSSVCKNILNGAMTRAPTDKNIVLGPTKTNFASSLYGGLKKATEDSNNINNSNMMKSQQQQQHQHHHHHHHHQQQQQQQQQQQSSSSRHSSHRQLDHGNNMGMKDYRTPRGPSYMGEKGFTHRATDKSTLSDRKYVNNNGNNINSNSNKNNNNNNNRYNNNGRHMNNNRTNNRHFHQHQQNDSDSNSEKVPEWMDYSPPEESTTPKKEENDLEAWKSNMKKRDGVTTAVVEKKEQHENKIDDALASLTLASTSDPLSFFDEANPLEPRREGGSRFAKFFAKREEPTQSAATTTNVPLMPRSISVNDLFQANPASPNSQQESVRIFSEDDVLKSLGANKNNEPDDAAAMGFNRVLQILSQQKPSLQQQQQTQQQEETVSSTTSSPSSLKATKISNKPSPSIANRFGNNLPTSVLRQMSAKSTTPTLTSATTTSTTTTTATATTKITTPSLLSHYSPAMKQQPQVLHPHHPPPPPPHPQYFYHPMMDQRAFEQLLQFNNPPPPHPPHGMPPLPHMMMPPPPPGQIPLMTPPPPPHFLQQQQQQSNGTTINRFPLQQQQQQRPMPPHTMNALPQQHMFNKNQGWERQ